MACLLFNSMENESWLKKKSGNVNLLIRAFSNKKAYIYRLAYALVRCVILL